jgi:molybdopterin molybdotransferase
MISVDKAYNIISQQKLNLGAELVLLDKALGRVLYEDIYSDRDLPPFNRICMDGIVINSEAYEKGRREFFIEDIQAAGMPQKTLGDSNNCLEAATGAVLPHKSDSVIPYEKIRINDGIATIEEEISVHANIHTKGIDRKKGDLLIPKQRKISFPEIGALASVGKTEVKVVRNPKILILSTGDELVDVHESPKTHQIRKSNVHVLQNVLKDHGISAEIDHIRDDATNIEDRFTKYFDSYDVLILSGAVSKGKYDFIPPTFEKMKVEKLFHRIKQRPGKPMWFGRKNDCMIFAFPGNPVSSFVCCLKYFIPWMQHIQGAKVPSKYACLAENFEFKPELSYFLQVKLKGGSTDGQILAYPVQGKGSGDFSNLVDVDGFIELPAHKTEFLKGEVFPLYSFRYF